MQTIIIGTNMDFKTCQDWWEKQVATGYFKEKEFSFSSPSAIKQTGLNKGGRVLEIGCGYGRETVSFIREYNAEMYVTDISQSSVDLAMNSCVALVGTKPFRSSYNGEVIPFERTLFDLIYSCFVIQHMSKNSVIKLIQQCLTRLNPKGIILFEFFGHPDFLGNNSEDTFSGIPNSGCMYNNAYTKKEIERVVGITGGKIEHIKEWLVGDGGKQFVNYWVYINRA